MKTILQCAQTPPLNLLFKFNINWYYWISTYLFTFHLHNTILSPDLTNTCTLRKKSPDSELFWSVFSSIWTEYEICRVNLEIKCGKMWTRKTLNTNTFHTVITIMINQRCKSWLNILFDFTFVKVIYRTLCLYMVTSCEGKFKI